MEWIEEFSNEFYEALGYCFHFMKIFLPLCILIAVPIAIVITVHQERGKQNEK